MNTVMHENKITPKHQRLEYIYALVCGVPLFSDVEINKTMKIYNENRYKSEIAKS